MVVISVTVTTFCHRNHYHSSDVHYSFFTVNFPVALLTQEARAIDGVHDIVITIRLKVTCTCGI